VSISPGMLETRAWEQPIEAQQRTWFDFTVIVCCICRRDNWHSSTLSGQSVHMWRRRVRTAGVDMWWRPRLSRRIRRTRMSWVVTPVSVNYCVCYTKVNLVYNSKLLYVWIAADVQLSSFSWWLVPHREVTRDCLGCWSGAILHKCTNWTLRRVNDALQLRLRLVRPISSHVTIDDVFLMRTCATQTTTAETCRTRPTVDVSSSHVSKCRKHHHRQALCSNSRLCWRIFQATASIDCFVFMCCWMTLVYLRLLCVLVGTVSSQFCINYIALPIVEMLVSICIAQNLSPSLHISDIVFKAHQRANLIHLSLSHEILIYSFVSLFINALVDHAYTNIDEQKQTQGVKTYNNSISYLCTAST